jgi:hypothetical protein
MRSEQSALDEARHAAALFRPVSKNRTGELDNTISPDGVYKLVRRYSLALGLKIGAHALRATAATTSPWIMKLISPRSRNGSAMPTLPPHAFTIGAR